MSEPMPKLNPCRWNCGRKTDRRCGICLIKAQVDDIPKHGEIGGGHATSRVYNVKSGTGNRATYILKRLKRDEPKLFQRVVDGKMSAHAAAVQAGWPGFQKPTIFEQIVKLWAKATEPEQKKNNGVDRN
jgi:hypothetical protein